MTKIKIKTGPFPWKHIWRKSCLSRYRSPWGVRTHLSLSISGTNQYRMGRRRVQSNRSWTVDQCVWRSLRPFTVDEHTCPLSGSKCFSRDVSVNHLQRISIFVTSTLRIFDQMFSFSCVFPLYSWVLGPVLHYGLISETTTNDCYYPTGHKEWCWNESQISFRKTLILIYVSTKL